MARSATSSAIAFPSEVARYLALDPDDVRAMIEKSHLPALRVPKKTRSVFRIPLRDFHAWLIKRTKNPTPNLADYDTFLRDFDQAARSDG